MYDQDDIHWFDIQPCSKLTLAVKKHVLVSVNRGCGTIEIMYELLHWSLIATV